MEPNPERTMVNFGEEENDKVELPTNETELLEAAKQAKDFEGLKKLVASYNTQFDKSYRGGAAADMYAATVTPNDPIIFRGYFDDCDAYIIQRNRVTQLVRKDKMKVGDPVKVQRTNGAVETDWEIDSMNNDKVMVRKGDLTKIVSYERLFEANTSSSPSL